MKIIKIKQCEYSNLEALLTRAGLVDKKLGIANPSRIQISTNTYRIFKKHIRAAFKKDHPQLSRRQVEVSVGFYLLDLGPAVIPNAENGSAIKTGYAIIID